MDKQMIQVKISKSPYWLGKKRPSFSKEWIENMRKAKQRQRLRDGYINSLEARKKCSLAMKGRPKSKEHIEKISGEKSNLWRGGVAKSNKAERERPRYKKWRTAIFERDNYTCQHCGQVGGKLNADHKIPFILLSDESEIPPYLKDYMPSRYDVDNGQTLCISCHRKTPTYGNGTAIIAAQLRKVYSSSEVCRSSS